MQKFKRTIDFTETWSSFYEMTKSLGEDLKGKSVDKYRYTLYDRALYIFDAHVIIEKKNNLSVIMILLRSLYEIKIKASKYQDDRNSEIEEANLEIKKEIEKFLERVEKGKSITFQILKEHLKDKKFEIKIKEERTNKRKTLRDNAEQADLGFDYETLYWLTSLFIHTHPLSLVIEHKEQYPENEIFQILDNLLRDVDLMNINVLGTMLWITTYLYEDIISSQTKKKIDGLWEISRELLSKKYEFNWIVDPNVELGTFRFMTDNGETIEFKRKQRK